MRPVPLELAAKDRRQLKAMMAGGARGGSATAAAEAAGQHPTRGGHRDGVRSTAIGSGSVDSAARRRAGCETRNRRPDGTRDCSGNAGDKRLEAVAGKKCGAF